MTGAARRRLAEVARRRPRRGPGVAVSPLAPAGGFPDLPAVAGLRLATAASGIRYRDRDDVMLALLPPGTAIAAVTTRSATRAAPVLDIEAKLAQPEAGQAGAAILVNAGNANAFTGRNGAAVVRTLAQAVADAARVPETRVFTSSTGVIGVPLPADRIVAVIGGLVAAAEGCTYEAAARAIQTTDTFPKGAGRTIELDGERISIAGVAKGSGMIAPDMATMLVYIFSDVRIEAPLLQEMVARQTERSFNCITVDSDTSTSDTLLVAATGRKGPLVRANSEAAAVFESALGAVMMELAHLVVRDGEGARKFVEVRITGARDDRDARRVGLAIANSPLVKTAIAGEDPNWGRIVMAVGKSGAEADRDRLSIRFGPHLVAENGWVAQSYSEATGAAYMRQQDLVIGVDLGLGSGRATVWTCDLTDRYIQINADYRS